METSLPPEIPPIGGMELERRTVSEQVYACSPGDLLASIISKGKSFQQLYLLSAASGAGKTTWCLEFVLQSHKQGLIVSGLLSPAVFNGGQKNGIDLLDLATQERRRLAFRPSSNQGETGLVTGAWCLDRDTLTWGNQCLRKQDDADILVMDEIGPLEFIHGKGLLAGLKLIDSGSYRLAIVTIRPSLLETAQQRWPHSQVIEIPKDNNTPGGGS
jgi:nucleoside-triphosphatase